MPAIQLSISDNDKFTRTLSKLNPTALKIFLFFICRHNPGEPFQYTYAQIARFNELNDVWKPMLELLDTGLVVRKANGVNKTPRNGHTYWLSTDWINVTINQ